MIQKGAVWRIGDGRNISLWDHNWLPEPGMSRVVSPKMDEGLNRVCDLFYPNTKTWTWEVLQKSFYLWEAEVIRKIYVSEACNTDCLVWSKTSGKVQRCGGVFGRSERPQKSGISCGEQPRMLYLQNRI